MQEDYINENNHICKVIINSGRIVHAPINYLNIRWTLITQLILMSIDELAGYLYHLSWVSSDTENSQSISVCDEHSSLDHYCTGLHNCRSTCKQCISYIMWCTQHRYVCSIFVNNMYTIIQHTNPSMQLKFLLTDSRDNNRSDFW